MFWALERLASGQQLAIAGLRTAEARSIGHHAVVVPGSVVVNSVEQVGFSKEKRQSDRGVVRPSFPSLFSLNETTYEGNYHK